jgi:hypothetical protein
LPHARGDPPGLVVTGQFAAGVSHKTKWNYSPLVSDCKKAITLARSSADASPPYGFMLLPSTISSGPAMKRFSFA